MKKYRNLDDWYYQHSWFSSYFWKKLKRVIMNVVYKLYTSIEESLLEKYLVEFEFYTEPSKSLNAYNKKHKTNYLGDFKCYLPIILMVKDSTEVESLVGIINTSLVTSGCYVVNISYHKKIITPESLKSKKEAIKAKFRAAKIGTINFQTLTPLPIKDVLEHKFESRIDKLKFTIAKCGSIDLANKPEYNVVYTKTVEG